MHPPFPSLDLLLLLPFFQNLQGIPVLHTSFSDLMWNHWVHKSIFLQKIIFNIYLVIRLGESLAVTQLVNRQKTLSK